MRSVRSLHTIINKDGQLLRKQPSGRIIAAFAHTEPAETTEPPASFAEVEEEKPPQKLNTSRLLPQHRKMLREERPYSEPHSWIHTTEKYNRMMFGRYGLSSGVDPRICFPTKSDLEEQAEYERVAFPHTIPEMIEINKKAKEEKRAQIRKREEELEKKLEKLDQWKRELNAKIAKKEAEAQAAKERKERLIEEVRRHFGFKVDPRDDRFKEMLEQKEREDRKKTKEAKRKAKEDKMLAKLQETAKGMNEKDTKGAASKGQIEDKD
ncbi:unnamed protein product [Hermetia illucens]|uniref:Large ribosomal subunit protein mL64 n=1 Tax=Hermetia illucens TaxID=343691 RepID=A0A7R8UJQ0_HERIL|nr:growth arrest and DNA damage-inducible proteins-interacting protein 1 [Hermetia illucens]CAD7081247.1 unnamed protein product [Hermetia illucens]